MKDLKKNTLLLGMGSDILGDDAVGLLAVRGLKDEFESSLDVAEAMTGGLKIMEMLEGYDRVLILDAIMTKQNPVGTIMELSEEQFSKTVAIAPHFVSLPEAIELARYLGIHFPKEIRILAMEISDPYRLTEELTPAVEAGLPGFIERARRILQSWTKSDKR